LKFTDLDLSESVILGLNDVQYTEPTPIQEQSIPEALKGRDVLGAAKTGSGKTGAFVIPILDQIIKNPSEGVKALIISPTRELASQIDEQIFALGYHTGISSATIIGGEDFGKQADSIKSGVDIIVATPGRLMDQMRVINIDFTNLKHLVLDEADRMLDMGFLPDIKHILNQLPQKRQNLLFSATIPDEIQNLIDSIMNDPVKIEIEKSKAADSVKQEVYFVPNYQKLELIEHILQTYKWSSCIVFSSTKKGTELIGKDLTKIGMEVATIHGDRDQNERNQALHDFKTGKVKIIVATDVLARGIDIDDVSLIVNYDVPKSPEDYIHRIGRTGRYDKTGLAITFVNRNDGRLFKAVEEKVPDIERKHRPEHIKNKNSGSKSGKSTGQKTQKTGSDNKKNEPQHRKRAEDSSPKHTSSGQKERDTGKQDRRNQKNDHRTRGTERDRDEDRAGRSTQQKPRRRIEIKRHEAATMRKPDKPIRHPKGFWGFIRSFFS
jgi:superfamily II DNA/RNA helicase